MSVVEPLKHQGKPRADLLMFYWAMAAFSAGIAILQISFGLFALAQVFLVMRSSTYMGVFTRERLPAWIFVACCLVSSLVAYRDFPTESLLEIHWAIVVFWTVGPLLGPRINHITMHRLMLIISVPGILFSIYWLLQPDELVYAWKKVGFSSYPRAFGFLSNPITYAEGLVLFAGWSLARLERADLKGRERKLVIAHMVISVLIVLFSRVRAGIVGFLVLFLLKGFQVPRFRRISTILCLSLAGLFVLSTTVFGFNTRSLWERLDLVGNSIELFQEYPVFGIGPNKYNIEFEGRGLLTRHPHNTLIGITTEHGLVGLAGYLVFMIALGKRLLALKRRYSSLEHPKHWVVNALGFNFVAYHLFGIFDYNYADTELLIIHAFHWGMILYLDKNGSQEE